MTFENFSKSSTRTSAASATFTEQKFLKSQLYGHFTQEIQQQADF